MRKIYKMASLACLGLMLSSQNMNAQVANFENLTLSTESFWDGSDLSGTHNDGVFSANFQSGDFIFPNQFDTTWGAPGYWLGGFAYSNMTDSITSGPGNKYSAKAGTGANNSEIYAICNNNSSLTTNSITQVNLIDFKITNSTYAYNSMRDGDDFAKKFGGASGDDPDWFKVTIKTFGNNVLIDTLDYYLADFRFSDNSLDYIKKDWDHVLMYTPSLSQSVDSIYFTFSSSDVGSFGMNTPAFLAIDDINWSVGESISELDQNNFSLYPNPTTNQITIESEVVIKNILITDLNGRIVLEVSALPTKKININLTTINPGVYFLKVVSEKGISVQRLIKQ
jgi:hypothetical protein